MNWPAIRYIPNGPQFEGDDSHLALGGDGEAPVNRPMTDLDLRTAVLAGIAIKNLAARTAAGSYSGAFRAVHAGTVVFAVGDSGEIQTSNDKGETWVQRSAAGGYTGTFRAIAATPALSPLTVVCGDGGEIQTAANLVAPTFTARTAADSYSGAFRAAVHALTLGLYVLAGDGGEIQTSPDGITWTHRAAAGSYSGTWRDIVMATDLGLLVLVGDDGEVQTSPDGITWTHRDVDADDDITSIAYSPDLGLIACDDYIDNQILSSVDGIVWVAHGSGGINDDANTFVRRLGQFVGASGAFSSDGLIWETGAQVAGNAVTDLGDRLVIVGGSGGIWTSLLY